MKRLPVDTLRRAAEVGAAWYPETASRLAELAARYDSDLRTVAGLFAAYSPRTTVSMHYAYAETTLATGQLCGMSTSHHPNARRALAGQPLSGPKVQAFYRALLGDHDAVVIDVYMLRVLFRDKPAPDVSKPRAYRRVARRFLRACRVAKVSPRDAQAGLWILERGRAH